MATPKAEQAAFLAAIRDDPKDDSLRLAFADWLDENGEKDRAAFVRTQVEAARTRPGGRGRPEQLDRADDLLAEHEVAWLGRWRDRLIDWEFHRGFLRRVRLTAKAFLRHGEELFRSEPVVRVELVSDDYKPTIRRPFSKPALEADAVAEVVAHPAFGFVRDCAVVANSHMHQTPVRAWLRALAKGTHVIRLRRFGPVGPSQPFGWDSRDSSDGIDKPSLAAFCRADHLRTLCTLDLSVSRVPGASLRAWLVPLIAEARFALDLRQLILVGSGVSADGYRRIATDRVFGNLRTLDLSDNDQHPNAWKAVFRSNTLTTVRKIAIAWNCLPTYARSPMATRVDDLTVTGQAEGAAPDRKAWLRLIGRAPPPRRLVLCVHNPGQEVFDAMREGGWLRDVRELSISGDSQAEAYSGPKRKAGLRSLFGGNAMPQLATLRLHEACDAAVLGRLARWRGTAQLEALELTDDYYGRFIPEQFGPQHPPERLRTLCGVVVITKVDIKQFLALRCLKRLTRLKLSFCKDYDRQTQQFIPRVSPAAAEQLLRSDRLANVTDLTLGFHHMPEIKARLALVLADPAVMPRLRRVEFYGNGGRSPLGRLRARFGPRLQWR